METAKKSHKKLWITLTAIVILLALLAFVLAGAMRGFQPGEGLYNSMMAREAGNSETYDFDQIERLEGNPLEGKHLAVLGSSVTYGAASLQNSLGEYFQQRFGMELRDKYDIGVLDLYHSKKFNDITPKQRELYMHDDIHPTKAGYREWWCPEMEKQLLAYYDSLEK